MFKGVKLLILLSILFLSACGNSNEGKNAINGSKEGNDSSSALSLYEKAINAFDANRYEEAMLLIDSIDAAYPNQLDIRRKVMNMRPRIKEKILIKEIQECDSLLVVYSLPNANASRETVFKTGTKKMYLEKQLQVARNQIVRLND